MAATPKKPAVKNPAVPADLVTVEALAPIRHDGVDVAPGEALLVSPEQAAELIAAGAAQAVAE